MKRQLLLAVFATLLFQCASTALAQKFPSKPVRLIVPYAAAGASDVLARGFAARLSEQLGQNVIVDNRGGSGGQIGTAAAVRSEGDGYTLLFQSGSIAMELAMKKKLPYDTRKDLVPVVTVARGPFAILVNSALPVNSVADLVEFSKKNPGKLNFGSSGVGSSIHMASELLKATSGVSATHIAYQGMSPAYTALIANDIQFVVDPIATARRFAEGGKVRAIALTSRERSSMWPGMPTAAESGAPGFEAVVWYGIFAPTGTPAPVVERINSASRAILDSKEMRGWLMSQGFEAVAGTPGNLKSLVEDEAVRWEKLIQTTGLKFE